MILVKNGGEYERHALMYIDQHTNIRISSSEDLARHLIYYPYTYPCLVEFYPTLIGENNYVSAIECGKKIAKSIVYPHTNKCNEDPWYRIDSCVGYAVTVKYLKAEHRCPSVSHVNRLEMVELSEKNEPFLIGYAICHGGKSLKMFLLKKEGAKKLVYYKKELGKNRQDIEKLRKKNREAWNRKAWKKDLATKRAGIAREERLSNMVKRLTYGGEVREVNDEF